jgi:hypothetical protein
MKAIVASILAFGLIAASGTAIARSMHAQRAIAEEACVGLSCWPSTPPIKHRSAYRVTLQPVW